MIEAPFASAWHEPKWYALFVRTNQEKKVAERLARCSIEHYLPCYPSLRQWKDRRVKLEIPVFPGYLFVRLSLRERMRALTLPSVICIVGRNSPAEIHEDEISWIRRAIENGTIEPHPYLQSGQRVVITEGVMSGMEGILVRRQKNTRVVVSLDSISRSFVVEIDTACVKSVAEKPCAHRLVQHLPADNSNQDVFLRPALFGN